MSARQDTPRGDELDVLATLVDAYEKKHFPIDAPDPIEAIKFRMEQPPPPCFRSDPYT